MANIAFAALQVGLKVAGAFAAQTAGRAASRLFYDPIREGRRIADVDLTSSTEGAAIARAFGRVRLTGEVIWAAKLKETRDVERQGGKGPLAGPRVETFTYSLSFAVALCEGPILGVGRVWANGEPFDLASVTARVYRGDEDQAPDPAIEAVEGEAPAYRGIAYVVFEDLPLEAFGNRVPHLSFEVIRPAKDAPGGAARLEDLIQAVDLIPASGEFAYATSIVEQDLGRGANAIENAHAAARQSDLSVALDQLAEQAPNLKQVAIVVGWFGDDLRCGLCKLRPGVETAEKQTKPFDWRVNDVERDQAHLVSMVNGRPAFGGTPCDGSIYEAIAEIKRRGWRVTLYPFIFMDIRAEQGLPDPYGRSAQPDYPWRGRITGAVAPGLPGSTDLTPAAEAQVAAFFGAAQVDDFKLKNNGLRYEGPENDFGLRRMVLHYAQLAKLAGGVDAFLIGSELVGLTQLRSAPGVYPAVAQLKALAADVKAVLGPFGTKVSYAADWTEYAGHRPAGESGELRFPLDPLWADPQIDMVAIDYYAPLTDWRDGAGHLDGALTRSIYDPGYLQSRFFAGEAYDWHYASGKDRAGQIRTPIRDLAHGEDWAFRAKDLAGWWSNAHYERPNGARASAPTAWAPGLKPIWLTELGFPAVDKGSNGPNVFVDPKSVESALPPFSSGRPDDLIQRRALEAGLTALAAPGPNNPISGVYGGPMLSADSIFVWCWDARPFPAFPALRDVWGDADNWRLGHWLNGRLGLATLSDVVAALCASAGLAPVDVSGLYGLVSGYLLSGSETARQSLERLAIAYDVEAVADATGLRFYHRQRGGEAVIAPDGLAAIGALPLGLEESRADPQRRVHDVRVRFRDSARDQRAGVASARGGAGIGAGIVDLELTLALDEAAAAQIAERAFADARAGEIGFDVVLAPSAARFEPGDAVTLADHGGKFKVQRVEGGALRRAILVGQSAGANALGPAGPTPEGASLPGQNGSGLEFLVIDAPPLPGAEEDFRPLIAVRAPVWPGKVAVYAGAEVSGLRLRTEVVAPAITGVTLTSLAAGCSGRWDYGASLDVRMDRLGLASASDLSVLNGANALLLRHASGDWELLQAGEIELVAANVYRFARLLRGQAGSEDLSAQIAPPGAEVVFVDRALARAQLADFERGLPLLWRAGPIELSPSDPRFREISVSVAGRALRPLAPAHLRAKRTVDGGLEISFMRRGRVNADNFDAPDIPIGSDETGFAVKVFDGANVVRSDVVAGSPIIYAASALGGAAADLRVSVAAISARWGEGPAASVEVA